MKLCLIKVGKSDACIRPLFANLVTITDKIGTMCLKLYSCYLLKKVDLSKCTLEGGAYLWHNISTSTFANS